MTPRIESLFRQLTVELGPQGIRMVVIRSAGSPDTRGVNEVFNKHAKAAGVTREEFDKTVTRDIPLRRLPRVAEIAGAAVLMASDHASAITGAVINVTCGAMVD